MLRLMGGKSSGLQVETVGDLTCRLVVVGRYVFQSSTRAKFRSSGSDRLGDAVSEQDYDLPRLQQDLLLAGKFAGGEEAEWGPVTFQYMFHYMFHQCGAVQHEARHVTRSGVDQRAAANIKPSQRHGNKMAMFKIFGQHAVHLGEDLVQFQVHGGKGAEIGAGKRHHQGGAKAVSLDVAQGDSQVAVGHGDEIKVVASGLVGGIGSPADVKARHGRRGSIELLLYFARQAQLKLLLFVFAKFGNILLHGDEVGQVAPLLTNRCDGLLRRVELARFLAVD